MNEQLRDDLQKVHDLLSKGWCQGDYAQDAQGQQVDYDDPEAVCFCLTGGIERAAPFASSSPSRRKALRRALEEQLPAIGGNRPTAAQFNDSHGKDEVLAVVDRAVKAASDLTVDGSY